MRQRIDEDQDGGASLRVTLKPRTWQLIQKYAASMNVSADVAARIFLGQIEALISNGTVSWLSADWQQSLKEAYSEAPPDLVGVDLGVLHRSTKTKSGFVGVYANGAGFRATGRRGEYLGTYKTGEIAAWQRYLHYQKNGLPYGELEVDIDQARKNGEQGSDDQLKAIVLETARLSGTLHLYGEEGERIARGDYMPRPPGGPQMLGFGSGGAEAAFEALKRRDQAEAEAEDE